MAALRGEAWETLSAPLCVATLCSASLIHRLSVPRLRTVLIVPVSETNGIGAFRRRVTRLYAERRDAGLYHRLSVPRLRTVLIVPVSETNGTGAFHAPLRRATLRSAPSLIANLSLPIHDQDRTQSQDCVLHYPSP